LVVAQRQARWSAESKRKTRSDAPAVVVDDIASGDAAVMTHRVQTERGAVRDRDVDVARSAHKAGIAEAERASHHAVDRRALADHVDRSAGGSAARERGLWSFDDFDLLEIERIARLRSEVADAVHEDVVARAESAQHQVVTGGLSTFSGHHGESGDVA